MKDKTEEAGDSLRIHVGDPLPQFTVLTLGGDIVSRDSLLGDVSLLVFFSTKCEDCRRTLPELQKAYVALQGRKVKFLCIARDESADVVAPFWQQNGFTMPCAPQKDRGIYNLFASSVVPRIFISDRNGIVRFTHDDTALPNASTIESEMIFLLKTE